MLRKTGLTLMLISGLASTNTFANMHPLTSSVAVDYEFKPNHPETFSNVFFWTVKAACTISSESEENPIHVFMKRKSAIVNDIVLKEGTLLDVTVRSGDTLVITADRGAQVELTNLGTVVVNASCTTIS